MESVGSSEAGSGRNTPRSIDQDTYRSDTPGTMPTHQYSKDELYDLQEVPASLIIPECLDRDFIVDGIWDPERWFRSFGGGQGSSGGSGSRGPSPLTTAEARERRVETSRRHSTSERSLDPKERLKEEKDTIVLSPQRRSFGTGCHVTHQPLLQRAISKIVDDRDRTDRDRRDTRRIGSGRIQIDRSERGGTERVERVLERAERPPERDFRDRERGDRGAERDNRDFRDTRATERDTRDFRDRTDRVPDRGESRDPRDFRNVRDVERGGERDTRDFRDHNTRGGERFEREGERDSRDFRDHNTRGGDRFERDDRDRDRRYERDRMFISRRDVDERPRNSRDFRDFNNRQGGHRNRHEDEPEWFSSGPISKSDTIELHGFERSRRDSEMSAEDRDERERAVVESRRPEVMEEEVEGDSDAEDKDTGGIGVADRNGSLETNESSSPETNQSDLDIRPGKTPPPNALFDFNEFFKIENIPGLSDDPVADPELTSIGGSRFYQLYRMAAAGGGSGLNQSGGSPHNSRRSSAIDNEFEYLNDLLNGSRSPVIPSPPPPSAAYDRAGFLSPFASIDKQQHIEFGTVGQKASISSPREAAMINNAVLRRNSPTGMSPQETEARLKAMLFGRTQSTSGRTHSTPSSGNTTPTLGMKESPKDSEARLKAILFGRHFSPSSSGHTTPGVNSPLNVPGKVKTLAELEGELQPSVPVARRGSPMGQQMSGAPRNTPPNVPKRGMSPQGDTAAFDKLIHLIMQSDGGGPRPESPKIPIHKLERRASSPLINIPAHLQQPQTIPQPHQLSNQHPVHHQPANHQSVHHQSANQHAGQVTPHSRGPPPTHQQFPPPQHIQKQEPSPIHAQTPQGDVQFGSMDNFSAMMGTPTTQAEQMDPHSETTAAYAAQKQFLQALVRNKEQQLQIRQAAINKMRYSQAPPTGQPGPAQQQQMATPSQHTTNQQTPAQQQSGGVPQRRLSAGTDPIMNFLKANPTIVTKAASPTPPPQQSQAPPPPIMNLVQHGASPRGPSPSPVIPQGLLSQQNPGTPRVPSPIMFGQQPPMHLNAPSPIHPSQGAGSLSQSPTAQSAAANSSNTIRPPSVPRVPSPQELVAHTQAILQNALLKKQLEDQKERFYKKQQERGKSPNPLSMKEGMILDPIRCLMTSVPQMVPPSTPTTTTKSAVNVAFTPTSVIRKMHSEKASEKEKQRRDSIEYDDKQVRPDVTERVPSTMDNGDAPSSNLPRPDQYPTSIPPPTMVQTIPPPPLPNQVLPNVLSVLPPGNLLPGQPHPAANMLPPPFNTNPMSHCLPPPPPTHHHAMSIPPPLLSPGGTVLPPPLPPHHQQPPPQQSLVTQEQMEAAAKSQQQIRALIGQGQSHGTPHGQSHGIQLQAVSSVNTSVSGRPLLKGIAIPHSQSMGGQSVQMSQGEVAAPHHRQIVGSTATPTVPGVDMSKVLQQRHFSTSPNVINRTPTSPNTPYGMPFAGRVPLQSTPIVGPQPPSPGTNPLLMQQMMQGANPRGMNQNQLNQFASIQQAQQAAQQRMLDPRGIRPPLPGNMMQMMNARNMTPGGHNPNPAHNSHYNTHILNPNLNTHKNGPVSPGQIPVSMVTNGNNNYLKQDTNVNLMKWFGTDMLNMKNQLPTMPPLPVQGQKVLTLDEIERS